MEKENHYGAGYTWQYIKLLPSSNPIKRQNYIYDTYIKSILPCSQAKANIIQPYLKDWQT